METAAERSEKAKKIASDFMKWVRSGRKPKYDKNKHPAQLVECFCYGNDVEAFLIKNLIGRTTFYNWVNEHEEFKEAYKFARNCAKEWYMEQARLGMQDKDFNFKAWSSLMANRFRHTDERKVRIKDINKAETISEKQKLLEENIHKGNFTMKDIASVGSYLTACIAVAKHEEIIDRLNTLEGTINVKK
jgi:hypothetical protein